MKMNKGNKTVRGYWDEMWKSSEAPKDIEPNDLSPKNYTVRKFHAYFQRVFATMGKNKSRLLEIGCANSVWLPYFNKEFGFDVTGLDYSEIGCEKARRNLERNGVNGDVVHADLFSPPSHMLESYDVVISFGVVEHFDDTSNSLMALSKYLKNGGVLITNIPNMTGLVGFVQKKINLPVFNIHNPIDSERFRCDHENASMTVIECGYFMSTSFGVCNLVGIRKGTIKWLTKKIVLGLLERYSMLVWLIEEKLARFPERQLFSPYINCIAIKNPVKLKSKEKILKHQSLVK